MFNRLIFRTIYMSEKSTIYMYKFDWILTEYTYIVCMNHLELTYTLLAWFQILPI